MRVSAVCVALSLRPQIALFSRPLIMLLIAIVGLGTIGSKQHNNTNTGLSVISLFIVLDLIGGIIGLVGRSISTRALSALLPIAESSASTALSCGCRECHPILLAGLATKLSHGAVVPPPGVRADPSTISALAA